MIWEIQRESSLNSRQKNRLKFFFSPRIAVLTSKIFFHFCTQRQRCAKLNSIWPKELQKRWKTLTFQRKTSKGNRKKSKNFKNRRRRKASRTSWSTQAKSVIFATRQYSARSSTYFPANTPCTASASSACSSAMKYQMHLS